MSICSATIREAPTHKDTRGKLTVLQGSDIAFPIKRIYYLHEVPIGAVRAEHGHRKLEQLMFCPAGAVDVMICNGSDQEHFTLADPATLLHVPPGSWRSVKFKQPGSVLCVLASRAYEPDDYIHDYEDFLAWKKESLNFPDGK